MSIHFAWTTEDDVFNGARHLKMDEDIFDLKIQGKEGDFTSMTGSFALPLKNASPEKPYCFVSFVQDGQETVLFKGRLITVPQTPSLMLADLFFVAAPSNPETSLKAVQETLKKTGKWDPLFVPENADDCPAEILDAMPYLYFWNPKTLDVGISHVCEGRQSVDIGAAYFSDSFSLKQVGQPLDTIIINLSAKWTQRYQGCVNIGPLIEKSFPKGRISSLTGSHLCSNWWRDNDGLKKTGYWIDDSRLKPYTPPKTGVLNVYPTKTAPLWVGADDPLNPHKNKPEQIRLKRSWFRARLSMGFDYKQKRKEIARIHLHQKNPLSRGTHPKTRTLNIHLNDLSQLDNRDLWQQKWVYSKGFHVIQNGDIYRCLKRHLSTDTFDDDRMFWQAIGPQSRIPALTSFASFFGTDRGKKAIFHAVDIGLTHLMSSARSVEIQCQTTLETALDITTDHTVSMAHPRIKGQTLRGKVKQYAFVFKGDLGIAYANMTLGSVMGDKRHIHDDLNHPETIPVFHEYVTMDDVAGGESAVITSPSGVLLKDWKSQTEDDDTDGRPWAWRCRDMVESLIVHNHADAQESYLHNRQYPACGNIAQELTDIPTTITLHLKDLRRCDLITKTIDIGALNPLPQNADIDITDCFD